ncbi:MAG TPA: hypothetical protein GX695_02575 [Acholeplasmataceae bacterium]|nr:hypothetical protein [Bacteroidales bacterium]HHX78621.1 hypothetical protein [Acholeplasmataceae bacterium]
MGKIIINYIQGGKYPILLYDDIVNIAQKCGYKLYLQPLDIYGNYCNGKDNLFLKLRYNFSKIPIFIKTLIQIPRNSKILLMYPHPFGVLIPWFCYLLKIKKCNITFVCVDLDSLRLPNKSHIKEAKNLNAADKLILHTPNMIKACRNINVTTPAELFHLTDYMSNDPAPETNGDEDIRVAFVGNFEKAPFIYKLERLNFKKVKFLLYGSYTKGSGRALITNEQIEYKGRFAPHEVSAVHGDWGLVWDGDSLEDKNENNSFRDYLKINIPSKAMLYIIANMPIIVWKEAGIASFVEANKIGFTITSLYEVEDKIFSLSQIEKETMKKNVRIFANKIRKGEMLTEALKKID